MKKLGSQLIVVGLTLLGWATVWTTYQCHTDVSSVRIATTLFLEQVCPAGRLDGLPEVGSWQLLFGKLALLWLLAILTLASGLIMRFRHARLNATAAQAAAGDLDIPRRFGRKMNALATPVVAAPVARSRRGDSFPPVGAIAMSENERRDFERQYRRAIEHQPLGEAETMLRGAITRLRDPILLNATDRPQNSIRLLNWDKLALAMASARERLAAPDQDRPWRAVILALVYRNTNSQIEIIPRFTFSAEPRRMDFSKYSHSQAQSIAWKEQYSDLVLLPDKPHVEANGVVHPTLVGLDDLRAVQSYSVTADNWHALNDYVQTAYFLAGAFVQLRFCQLCESALADQGLPLDVPAFLAVDQVEWPIESGTVDYCREAVRLVGPGDR